MRKIAVAALVVAIALASPALAQKKNGFSLGGSLGSARIELDGVAPDFSDFSFEGDDLGYKIYGGFRFLRFLGVEAGYVDLGNPSYSTRLGDATLDTDFALSGWNACAVAYIPIFLVDVFFKVGYFWWDGEIRARLENDFDRITDSGSDLVYGIGVAVWLGPVAIRGEFEYFDVNTASTVWLASAGVSYTF
jgi:hypothetical protein